MEIGFPRSSVTLTLSIQGIFVDDEYSSHYSQILFTWVEDNTTRNGCGHKNNKITLRQFTVQNWGTYSAGCKAIWMYAKCEYYALVLDSHEICRAEN